MPTSAIKNLQHALQDGLGIVTRIWDYDAKNWVTSVCAADIDDDGDFEIIVCSRDGRVYLLSKTGELRWKRVIGNKAWVGAIAVSNFATAEEKAAARIIVGTRDGKVYALDKDGRMLTKDGQALSYDTEGNALDPEQEQQAYWHNTGYVIRQINVDPRRPSQIIMGSEDRCAYGLDYATGEQLWKCQTNGWVRTVFSCDVNGDGETEILVGSVDKYLYLLDSQGQLITRHFMKYPVRTISAADIDEDGHVEIFVTTDGKDLTALTYREDQTDATTSFEEIWHRRFSNRLLSLCITDIDGDKKLEIIAGSQDKYIYILDFQGNTIWRDHNKYRAFSIYSHDLDNDGQPELLVGSDNNRIRAMRVELRRDIEKKVRRYHRQLEKADPTAISQLKTNEYALLQDILHLKVGELVTLEQAQEQMRKGHNAPALAILLKLEQQKVERSWYKNTIGHIRTVCLRHSTGEPKREIIVGTSEGNIHAFHVNGRGLWLNSLEDNIVDVQTGFIDQHKQEEIVICSSDHHVYILDGTKKQNRREALINDSWMSSICVRVPHTQGPSEIIIGSEDKKLSIFGSDLQEPIATIHTEEGVKIVRAHAPTGENTPEIVAASLGNHVYAYSRNIRGEIPLWTYETRDHIRAVCIKDINGDGKVEVLVGSEDRNIHVIDSTGHFLWRYYLPDTILAVDAAYIDQNSQVEVFAACADGYLYVFNHRGDLLWKYMAGDRIHAVRVEDIDSDGNVEIALGSEEIFELLRVVNPQQISSFIIQCWATLRQQHSDRQAIEALLSDPDPFLQAFALNKLAEQVDSTSRDVDTLEKFALEGAIEVRKAIVQAAITLYPKYPSRIRTLLYQLSVDNEPDVRNAIVEHIPALINHDWELGFNYLKRASENPDRYVRRIAVRKLHQLIDTFAESPVDRHREIFDLLFLALQDTDSEWIRQEAARTLAYYLNRHYGNLITYVHLFIVKSIPRRFLEIIAHATTTPIVKHYINILVLILPGLSEENAHDKLQQAITTLEAAATLIYGRDIRLIYSELAQLLTIQAIEDIAYYRCLLTKEKFDPSNEYAKIILAVFDKLSTISRPLKLYLQRESIEDRLTGLLETIEAIDAVQIYVRQQYSIRLMGESMTKLPDHQVFRILLAKWRKVVQTQLNELRGKAELKVELQTRDVRNEEQIGILLTIKNTGRSSATEVKIALLHNEYYEVVGNNSFDTEVILPGRETIAEFILKPHNITLSLRFEIVYNNADKTTTIEKFEDCLELRECSQEFRHIPNPYSTGTPTHDSSMFYGRERDIAFLKDNLTRDVKSVVVLYGQRRSGKTTLLVQLINSSIPGEHIPVLIDMQRVSYHITIENFLRRVAYSIAQALKRKNLLITTPDSQDFQIDPIQAFDVFLDQLEEKLVRRRLILLIDEFEILEEHVTRGNLQPEIFEYLRDIVQHRRTVNFLFAGTHKITEYTKWYRSVFFNIALHYRLSQLDEQGAEDLIQKPVAGYLEYEPLTVKKIRRLTADQPYLIHLICRAIVDYCNARGKTYVTINDVNIVQQEVMQTGQYHFDWLWDQIKPEERVALAAIAEGGKEEGRWLLLAELEDFYRRYRIPYKQEYILDSLKMLSEADLIEVEPGDSRKSTFDSQRFRIPVGLTRGWLLKEHPLELVRKEMNG
jgi:outer membrane protein assembly factor BamB/archaellum biogenesis ATPase FlaH